MRTIICRERDIQSIIHREMDTSDVREILDMSGDQQRPPPQPEQNKLSKDSIMNPVKDARKLKKSDALAGVRRPTGMNREVYALLYSDNKDRPSSPSLVPTDIGSGYRQPKARLGRKHVRPWKWMPFTNDARNDSLVLSHWRRVADEGKPYPFTRFNKSVDVPSYTKEEYEKLLVEPTWTKEETDHLMELCMTFDLRFIIIQDRFDTTKFQKRSVEALKERYYSVCNRLSRARDPNIEDSQLIAYDAPHECRRKMQLEKLLNRTAEQVQEEEVLVAELRKIELRKKERERKQQDLQKLISAAEQNTESRKNPTKKVPPSTSKKLKSGGTPGHSKGEATVVFKSYDKSSGVSLRSSKLKTPMTLGQKKAKTIEQLLDELGVPLRPMPTEQICVQFNDLRNDILLLLDLKSACDVCEFELQSLKHRYEALSPSQQSAIGTLPDLVPHTPKKPLASGLQIIDVVSSASGGGRKRRMATLDSPVTKKARKS